MDSFSNDELRTGKGEKRVRWRYLIYDLAIVIKEVFFGPGDTRNGKDLDFVSNAQILLTSHPDEHKLDQLINLHRTYENTKARKRLEKWAKKVIVLYLVAVGAIFVLSAIPTGGNSHIIECSPEAMIALLTTTAINIIGLMAIVLRGHFPQKDRQE